MKVDVSLVVRVVAWIKFAKINIRDFDAPQWQT